MRSYEIVQSNFWINDPFQGNCDSWAHTYEKAIKAYADRPGHLFHCRRITYSKDPDILSVWLVDFYSNVSFLWSLADISYQTAR